MLTKLLNYADNATDGAIRRKYRRAKRALAFDSVARCRKRVADIVGDELYRRVGMLGLVVFPNRLSAAQSLTVPGYAMEKILLACSISPQQFNPWQTYDVYMDWQDLTRNAVDSRQYLQQSYAYTKVKAGHSAELNFDCVDIGKSVVGGITREVFGYDLDINPRIYQGRAVRKSIENATHDGEVIHCPIEEFKNGSAYNILIDNTDGDDVVDFRVIYIKGVVDFFYEKRRAKSDRFSNANKSVAVRELSDEFTPEEIAKLGRFCTLIGADYGELDVLRDKNTGRIYVVDFAKTPAGPPNGLPNGMAATAVERMAVAFIRNALEPHIRRHGNS